MSDDLKDDDDGTLRAHRCRPKNMRRGRPRVGDRASCVCGAAYVWAATPFRLWVPISTVVSPGSHVRGGAARTRRITGE